jgi:flagellar basal-body rod protein FlgG
LGTRVAATQRVITQGPLQTTENPTDVGIQGEGYFRVTLPDGTTGYTRDGSFKLDSQRRLVTSDGYLLADGITFNENSPVDSIVIAGDGQVSETPAGGTQQNVGRIMLARFVNPAGLTAIGKNLFIVSEASGQPIEGNPGEDGAGTLTQGTLEMSNVQIVEEMVNMIVSQRAYESNSKAITTSDSMLEIANGLKR